LDVVLADIAAREVDLTGNRGDILSGGSFPVETADGRIPISLPTIKGRALTSVT